MNPFFKVSKDNKSNEAKVMSELELLSPDFQSMVTLQIRSYINQIFFDKNLGKAPNSIIGQCFHEFNVHTKNQKHKQSILLKQLLFIHMVFQLISLCSQSVNQTYQIMITQLTSILQLLQNTQNKDRSKSFSTTAIDWVKRKVSLSKQKSQSKNNVRLNSQISKSINQGQQGIFPDRKHLEPEIESISEMFNQKVMKPYATYLLKLLSIPLYNSLSYTEQNIDEHTWKLINLLHKLTSFGQVFCNIYRYSPQKYRNQIVVLTRVLHQDIKKFYSELQGIIRTKKTKIDEIFLGSKSPQYLKQNQAGIVEQLNLEEYKHFLEQIAVINQKMSILYLNKYIMSKLLQSGIKPPKMISTTGKQFDLLFQIVNKYEKKRQKSRSKPKTSSRKDLSLNKHLAPEKLSHNRITQQKKIANPALQQKNRLQLSIKSSQIKTEITEEIQKSQNQRETTQYQTCQSSKFKEMMSILNKNGTARQKTNQL